MSRSWIQLGVVGRPHGLRGAFFIAGRDELLPESLGTVWIGPQPEKAPSFAILGCRWQSGRVQLELAGLTSREAVDDHKGQALWCQRQDLEIDETSEYLWADLIGRQVLDLSGELIGVTEQIQNHGASDILTLRSRETGRYLDIPLVESYVRMDFGRIGSPLQLTVNADVFDEAWYSDA